MVQTCVEHNTFVCTRVHIPYYYMWYTLWRLCNRLCLCVTLLILLVNFCSTPGVFNRNLLNLTYYLPIYQTTICIHIEHLNPVKVSTLNSLYVWSTHISNLSDDLLTTSHRQDKSVFFFRITTDTVYRLPIFPSKGP